MAVTIAPNSAHLAVTARPTVPAPTVSGNVMFYQGAPIRATGQVTLQGREGDSAAAWRVGFIQAQWIETNWCVYRGQNPHDGSIFVQRARAPARPHQACRDCVQAVGNIWYSVSAGTQEIANGTTTGTLDNPFATFPQQLTVQHFDRPSETCPLTENNTLTHKLNYLSEVQLEFFFCTVLTVRDPAGNFHHQASFYWNQRWQTRFPTTFTMAHGVVTPHRRIAPVAAGTGVGVGNTIRGGPSDSRFVGVLTSAQTQNCNQVFQAARAAVSAAISPNRHQSANRDALFDVRR
jgi:hypothetical protein